MSKKKPSIKKVNRNDMTMRASKDTFTALRYFLGNMSREDFKKFCRDDEMVREMESLWLTFAESDFT